MDTPPMIMDAILEQINKIPPPEPGPYEIQKNGHHPNVLYGLLYATARRYNNLARAHALLLTKQRPTNSSSDLHPFPFLRLPRELRNEIYTLSLRATSSVEAVKCPTYTDAFEHPHKPPTPGLLYVSKQVYSEARDILYVVNTFRFRSPDQMLAFEDQVGEWNSRLVRGLDILVCIPGVDVAVPAPPRPVAELMRMTTRKRKRRRIEADIRNYVTKVATWSPYPTHWAAALQRTQMNGIVRLCVKAEGAPGVRMPEELRECIKIVLEGGRECVRRAKLQLELTGFEGESRRLFPLHWEVVLKETEMTSEFMEILRQYEEEKRGCGRLPLPDEGDADL